VVFFDFSKSNQQGHTLSEKKFYFFGQKNQQGHTLSETEINKDIHFLKRSFIFLESVFYVVSCWCYFDLISKK